MSGSRKGCTLVVRRGGAVVASLFMPVGAPEVIVGRSHACDLRTPADDMTVSGRHARVFWLGGLLLVEDVGSTGGTFLMNRRLERPARLTKRTVFSLGDCLLTVEALPEHRLEWICGGKTGRRLDLRPRGDAVFFSIGSASDCDLVLRDALVSRLHARIEFRDDGSCWLHDCDSRNGTFRNGARLSPGKAVRLSDNDRIALSRYEFRFLDRAGNHPLGAGLGRIVRHFMLGLGLLLVLLFLAWGGVWLYRSRHAQPVSQADEVSVAFLVESNVARGDFRRARALLDEIDKSGRPMGRWQPLHKALKHLDAFEGYYDELSRPPEQVRLQLIEELPGRLEEYRAFRKEKFAETAGLAWAEPLVRRLDSQVEMVEKALENVNRHKQK